MKPAFNKAASSFKEQEITYKNSTHKNRWAALKELEKSYLKMNNIIKSSAESMQMYSNDLLADFSDRLRQDRNREVKASTYQNSYRVCKYEFYRAQKALRNGQYRYSSHLYDRGITILKNAYKKLAWALPPTYSK